ncbi:MAG: hypothetical protein K2W85_00470 [Phycisphaerales bacterium]|nr:hypothetical protein [Phycisphaerales bacterium]
MLTANPITLGHISRRPAPSSLRIASIQIAARYGTARWIAPRKRQTPRLISVNQSNTDRTNMYGIHPAISAVFKQSAHPCKSACSM